LQISNTPQYAIVRLPTDKTVIDIGRIMHYTLSGAGPNGRAV